MDCLGVIGYGQMGRMLVNGFISFGALRIDEVVVSSKTSRSLEACAAAWPGIGIATTNAELARRCRTVIIAVRPQEVMTVLREIAPAMDEGGHVVSLAAGVDLADIETAFTGSVTRVMPTVTSAVGQGTTLICHGRQIAANDALRVERIFSSIGNVMIVEEGELPAATLLSSCGPGLLAAIIEELAGATARASGLPPDQTLVLATEMVAATSAYLMGTGESPPDLIRRVATGGGITEVGVQELRQHLPEVLDEVFSAMLERHDLVGQRYK